MKRTIVAGALIVALWTNGSVAAPLQAEQKFAETRNRHAAPRLSGHQR